MIRNSRMRLRCLSAANDRSRARKQAFADRTRTRGRSQNDRGDGDYAELKRDANVAVGKQTSRGSRVIWGKHVVYKLLMGDGYQPGRHAIPLNGVTRWPGRLGT